MADHTPTYQHMFGCSLEEFMQSVNDSVTYQVLLEGNGEPVALAFYAASLLSNAQEQLAMGRTNEARQTINQAKYLLTLIYGIKER